MEKNREGKNVNTQRKILIADDVSINREILKTLFWDTYEVIEAANGQVALDLIHENKDSLALILLDILMPTKTGLEVLEEMQKEGLIDVIPVIVITGFSTTETDMRAYEYGAADVIHKPFSRKITTRRVLNVIEQYEYRNRMEELLSERTKSLEEKNIALKTYQDQIAQNNKFLMNALSSVIAFRSAESGDHIARVRTFTEIMLRNWKELHEDCNLDEQNISLITSASALHDIGKIAIPDAVLNKPGKLTDEEYELMKTHTILGCEILENFKQVDSVFYRYCYDICRYHHERYDGNGYPDHLKGEEIPLWAQIVSIVDVYDALTHARVYKGPYSLEKAYRMIENGECGVFSKEILECFNHAKEELIKTEKGQAYD